MHNNAKKSKRSKSTVFMVKYLCEISIGAYKGNKVFIPRMALIPTDSDLPFEFSRVQFPLRPAFCMTINKAQGQTLERVSIWLWDEHVFTQKSKSTDPKMFQRLS